MDTIADYNAWKAKQQQTGVGAAQVVLGSVNEKPDEVAGDMHLANEFGKVTGNPVPPLPMVREYRNVFQQKIEEQKNATILSASPKLTDWLRNPENAAVARDDLQNLSWFEGFGRGAYNSLDRAGARVKQMGNQYMLNQTAGRFQDRQMSFGQILDSERTVATAADGTQTKLWPNLSDVMGAAGRYIDARYADLIDADDAEAARGYAAGVQANVDALRSIPKSQIATDAEKVMFQDGASVGRTFQNVGKAILTHPLGVLSATRGRRRRCRSHTQPCGRRGGDWCWLLHDRTPYLGC
ncbi:MAG: hypothetical protein EOQ34_19910 [Mesorhizobium sp.]|nr:hypothetical protein [Mesorhizobium sp.]RWF70088.1 MAG: hypothetical protein EOQ34_19910 [Mesorhizobium sp.]